jgi:hypothetical protein
MSMLIFLSYSHKSKRLAHELKEGLEAFDFDVFLAHEDIKPSKPWRREIRQNLRNCQVFIPLLTKGFLESEWTDQETGFALALKKMIIPLKIHQNPHGFIGSLQAVKWRAESPYLTCWKIVECLREDGRFAKDVRAGAIKAFLSANDFKEEVPHAISHLVLFRPFSGEELHRIIEGSARNQGIYGCFAARRPMEDLIHDAKGKVSPRVIRRYRKAVERWDKR